MSLRSARVRDFQSVRDCTVEFGDFTVLVGPSNSGKSGYLRGIRACLRNSFVPANVRQGATKSIIGVEFTDSPSVEIMRGKSLSSYLIGSGAEAFTKSGRTVPPEVAAAIRMPLIEGVDASFAFQFDKPFLLSETGSQAGQVIGSLTNVSMLHTAVREANRRRQEATGVLRTRQGDIARHLGHLKEFVHLKARRAALEQVDQILAEVQRDEQQVQRVRQIVATVTQTQQALDTLTAEEPPDVLGALVEVETLNGQLRNLTSAVDHVRRLASTLQRLATEAKVLRDEALRLEAQRTQQLQELGTCPTCGASTLK